MGKKVLFATDVDGTLLSSCIPEGEQMVIVDDRHNYKGCMTQSNYDILREISRYADIVPITARSTNSSKQLFSAGLVEYKLVENGAVLLHNNVPVYAWKQQSEQLFGEATEKELFSNINSVLLKNASLKPGMAFTIDSQYTSCDGKCSKLFKRLQAYYKGIFNFYLTEDAYIYVERVSLSKGENLRRFNAWIPHEYVVSAGDTLMDETMEEVSDLFISRKDVNSELGVHEFAKYVLERTLAYCKEVNSCGR